MAEEQNVQNHRHRNGDRDPPPFMFGHWPLKYRENTEDPEVQQQCILNFNKKFNQNVQELRPLQSLTLKYFTDDKDIICMLPTGYGKSLIYELLPTVVDIFQGQDTKTLVFIIAPLNVIIKQELQKLGTSCIELKRGNTHQLKSSICDVNFIIGHPEAFVNNKDLAEIVSALPVNVRTFIVIDEAHCVLEWGAEFRPAYQELSCLRILLPKAPVLAMSATLTLPSQQQLAHSLCLRHFQSVLQPPAHAHTFLSVKKRPVSTDTLEVVEPLLVDILTKKQNCPVTIVYFNGCQNWVGLAYEYAERFLGKKLFVGEERDLHHARVAQFHSCIDKKEDDDVRKIILENLSRDPAESPLKIVFATSALGMGADLQHVVRVVNIGTPKTIEAYVQQTGRAGRGGGRSEAILYHNSQDLGVSAVTDSMKNMCTNTSECRQTFLNKCFGFSSASSASVQCCDVCFPHLATHYQLPLNSKSKKTLCSCLVDYVQKDTTHTLRKSLTCSVIQQIAAMSKYFNSCDDLCSEFNLERSVAESVYNLLAAVNALID